MNFLENMFFQEHFGITAATGNFKLFQLTYDEARQVTKPTFSLQKDVNMIIFTDIRAKKRGGRFRPPPALIRVKGRRKLDLVVF